METEIRDRPAFAHLAVRLQPGESIVAESGAMASMSAHTVLNARWNGGFFGAILRKLFGGETLFVNDISCPAGAQTAAEVVLTQPTPGDMYEIKLSGTSMFLQSGAFLACTTGIQLTVAWAGFKSLLGGEGLFRLKVSGTGTVYIGAYGSIVARDLGDRELIVDTNHLVAFEPTVSLTTGLVAGVFSSLFSGEGFVMRVKGPGRVLLQTRSLEGLAAWTNGYLY